MRLRKVLIAAVLLPLSSWTIVSQFMLMYQVSIEPDAGAANTAVNMPRKKQQETMQRRKAIDENDDGPQAKHPNTDVMLRRKQAIDGDTIPNKKAPLFLLHVGPPKTGTSTIQAFAATHLDVLKQDNIHYLGHYGKRDDLNMHEFSNLCRACVAGEADCKCHKKWAEFEKLVRYHHSKNHNVMVSDETFYRYKTSQDEQLYLWDHLVPLLQDWDLRVVFTYRRYYDWVVSTYHQSYNPRGKKRKSTRESWPDKDGLVIPSFPSYLDQFMSAQHKQPPALKHKWDEHFPNDNVWVFNMHGEGSFLRNFFCKMMPEAKQLCLLLKKQNTELTHNPSAGKVLHYDMVTTEAYQRGLVKKGLSRTKVNRAVRDHSAKHNLNTMADFPLKCLNANQTKALLKMSMDIESKMVPKFYETPNGKDELVHNFAEATHGEKFCSVDVDRILKDDRWKKFFKELK